MHLWLRSSSHHALPQGACALKLPSVMQVCGRLGTQGPAEAAAAEGRCSSGHGRRAARQRREAVPPGPARRACAPRLPWHCVRVQNCHLAANQLRQTWLYRLHLQLLAPPVTLATCCALPHQVHVRSLVTLLSAAGDHGGLLFAGGTSCAVRTRSGRPRMVSTA